MWIPRKRYPSASQGPHARKHFDLGGDDGDNDGDGDAADDAGDGHGFLC